MDHVRAVKIGLKMSIKSYVASGIDPDVALRLSIITYQTILDAMKEGRITLEEVNDEEGVSSTGSGV